jgi:nitroimidazol reductase NimA-like FMN-containing flavoprotein (pyridoxamine 5'-phosphate oxidase superfamily)
MVAEITSETQQKLTSAQNIWFGSVRPDCRPHLVPVWFIFHDGKVYISTDPASTKVKNIRTKPQVVLALEDGLHPVICEGQASVISPPYAEVILEEFRLKYEWDITKDTQYHQLVEITPQKWLIW